MIKKGNSGILVIVLVIIIAIGGYFLYNNNNNKSDITNFEECIAAGNPAMESYPRQCRDPISDRTFREEINDYWRLDNINLMQHETEGFYGCFGCSEPVRGEPGLCIDPTIEMNFVDETSERYCGEDFEVVEA